MKLHRWAKRFSKVEAEHASSSVDQATIQREIERLNAEVTEMRSEIAALKSAASPGHVATEIPHTEAATVDQAKKNSARGLVVQPTPVRGRAGGKARARDAWRCLDGTFMSDRERMAVIEDLEHEEYERHAAGGRARAACGVRNADGTWANNEILGFS
jgi:hypothetical protein